MRRVALAAAATLPLLLTGCLTHMRAPEEARHMEVAWRPSLTAAQREAAAADKPVLLCMIAGEVDGLC